MTTFELVWDAIVKKRIVARYKGHPACCLRMSWATRTARNSACFTSASGLGPAG
jgi:hypothetical protein